MRQALDECWQEMVNQVKIDDDGDGVDDVVGHYEEFVVSLHISIK